MLHIEVASSVGDRRNCLSRGSRCVSYRRAAVDRG